jgi:hypothetical protein
MNGWGWWLIQLAVPIIIILALLYMELLHILGVYPI